jgi:hypothetical protein
MYVNVSLLVLSCVDYIECQAQMKKLRLLLLLLLLGALTRFFLDPLRTC